MGFASKERKNTKHHQDQAKKRGVKKQNEKEIEARRFYKRDVGDM